MAVPMFPEFMKPILEVTGDGKEYSLKNLVKIIGDHFKLTEEDRELRLPSGTKTVLYSRVSWGCTYLKKAELISYTGRGKVQITDKGQEVLKENPPIIDSKYLKKFESFRAFNRVEVEPGPGGKSEILGSEVPPDEQMEDAYQKINQDLADNILDEVLKMSKKPTVFEQFVVDLLEQMGYGAMKYGSHTTKASGDDGIDGVIMQDKLGFNLIYMQAKCWDKKTSVGQPEIQKFLGAIYGKHGDGLFVTTAKFSQKAQDYAKKNHIILIDGNKLAHLMIEYNFCVSVKKTYKIRDIDTDAMNEYLEE